LPYLALNIITIAKFVKQFYSLYAEKGQECK